MHTNQFHWNKAHKPVSLAIISNIYSLHFLTFLDKAESFEFDSWKTMFY